MPVLSDNRGRRPQCLTAAADRLTMALRRRSRYPSTSASPRPAAPSDRGDREGDAGRRTGCRTTRRGQAERHDQTRRTAAMEAMILTGGNPPASAGESCWSRCRGISAMYPITVHARSGDHQALPAAVTSVPCTPCSSSSPSRTSSPGPDRSTCRPEALAGRAPPPRSPASRRGSTLPSAARVAGLDEHDVTGRRSPASISTRLTVTTTRAIVFIVSTRLDALPRPCLLAQTDHGVEHGHPASTTVVPVLALTTWLTKAATRRTTYMKSSY